MGGNYEEMQQDAVPMEVEQDPPDNDDKEPVSKGRKDDKEPVSKRRKIGGSKRRKSKCKKSKKRKSKRKTHRKKNPKRNKLGGFELPRGYESCEGCKCIRKIDNEISPDPRRGPPPFPDMGAIRINNSDINDDNNNNPGDDDKPPLIKKYESRKIRRIR